ncbi:MAG: respiratory nitrate reductase subunit gamma [candidate division Zixibacteria bacterium]
MNALQLFNYIAIAFFALVVLIKMIRIARMPIHLRWDLYPIPHEKGKGEYGGSYYEEIDWWTKPRDVSLFSELKEMAKEIIFVHSVYKNNRSLWIFSFPFHFGLYCLIGFLVLILIGALMGLSGNALSSESTGIGTFVYSLTNILGTAGWALSIIGGTGLFLSRIFRNDLRGPSVMSDYVNLLFMLAFLITGFIAGWMYDGGYVYLRSYAQSLITFSPAGVMPPALETHLWALGALLFYYPFTHMTHVFSKYFTYHKIRWEDSPNTRGSKIEKSIINALGYRVSWSASHIKAGSTWAEVATTNPTEEKKDNG